MKKLLGTLWKFGLAAIFSIFLLILITNIVAAPVAGPTRNFEAAFTDISGLHEGADVRVRGVRVGKVQELGLERVDGRTIAKVHFSMDREYSIVSTSRLAVKFQALTGLRFLDVGGAVQGNVPAGEQMKSVPTTMTQPSFDVTVLFNGLQPVLATLDPNEINTFTDNVATFLDGDGSGLAPMLESLRKLTALISDRDAVISSILHNLQALAHGVRGRSESVIKILEQVKLPIDSALSVLDEFRKSQLYGPTFTGAVVRIMNAIGLKPGWKLDTALDRAITNLYNEIDGIKRIPVVFENVQPPPADGQPLPCTKGRAELPLPMDVLLNGRKVVICNH